MIINIFIICHNERILLPFTVSHYKNIFSDCVITIYDNESSDNSVEIAKSLGCNVISWSSNDENNAFMKCNISNNCWKTVKDGWVIVIDMDELLFISEYILMEEQEKGTTILSTQGIQMVGESKSETLDDIDLNEINRGLFFNSESKCVCFYKPKIKEMNYTLGCHRCNPIGCVKLSDKHYIIEHFSFLGLPFIIAKTTNRFERSKRLMKEYKVSTHYTDKKEHIEALYYSYLKSSFLINAHNMKEVS